MGPQLLPVGDGVTGVALLEFALMPCRCRFFSGGGGRHANAPATGAAGGGATGIVNSTAADVAVLTAVTAAASVDSIAAASTSVTVVVSIEPPVGTGHTMALVVVELWRRIRTAGSEAARPELPNDARLPGFTQSL